MICGIYKIVGPSGFYVGSSVRIEQRWYNHRRALDRGDHANEILQRAWDKYGEANFTFVVIHECSRDELDQAEQRFIAELKPRYNIKKIANGGWAHSDKTKQKMSASAQAYFEDPENRKKNGLKRRGKTFTKEQRQRMRASMLAYYANDPTSREKIGEKSRGRECSEATRKKISEALKVRVFSEEHKRKLRESCTRRSADPAYRAKLGDAVRAAAALRNSAP
jgi:group I intron endonuclease